VSTNQVQQLIDAVKSASPVLWQAARQQVQADLVANLLLALIWLALATGMVVTAIKLGRWGKRLAAKNADIERSYDRSDAWLAATGGSVLTAILALTFTICVMSDLWAAWFDWQAPNFAAIHQLMGLLPGNGG
jgi:hypothetical protein